MTKQQILDQLESCELTLTQLIIKIYQLRKEIEKNLQASAQPTQN